MRRMVDPYLYHREDGRLGSKTLCTSNVHANNIIRDLMLRLDPHQRVPSNNTLQQVGQEVANVSHR